MLLHTDLWLWCKGSNILQAALFDQVHSFHIFDPSSHHILDLSSDLLVPVICRIHVSNLSFSSTKICRSFQLLHPTDMILLHLFDICLHLS